MREPFVFNDIMIFMITLSVIAIVAVILDIIFNKH
jgi:hypothetical protein